MSFCFLLTILSILSHCSSVQLSQTNFTEAVGQGRWFIRFYADWCEKCKRMKKDFEAVANELDGVVSFGHVNCHMNKQICDEYDITGYPILKFFENGKPKGRFGESYTHNLMKRFSHKMLAQPVETLSPSDINLRLTQPQPRATLVLLAPEIDPVYLSAAKSFYETTTQFIFCNLSIQNLHKDENFLIMLDLLGIPQQLRPKSDSDQLNMHVILASSHSAQYNIHFPHEKGTQDDAEEIERWLSMMQFEFVPLFNRDVNDAVKKERRPVVLGIVNGSDSRETKTFLSSFRQAALEHVGHSAGQFVFAYVDVTQLPYFLSYFSLRPRSLPTIAVHSFAQSQTWCNETQTEWKLSDIRSFIHKVQNGEMKPKETHEGEEIDHTPFKITHIIKLHKQSILIGLVILATLGAIGTLILLLRTAEPELQQSSSSTREEQQSQIKQKTDQKKPSKQTQRESLLSTDKEE